MTAPTRYVATSEIRTAIKGREIDLLEALGIHWKEGRPHIACPYRGHADNNPSWRWDQHKARAYCTCHPGAHSALDVLMHTEGIDFETAKIRAAELLKRPDLIRQRRVKKRKGEAGEIPLLLTLIEAHALLNRERRDRDEQGRIVATLVDYAIVRELVADVFAEGVEGTVKPETRETVAAVKTLLKAPDKEDASLAEIKRVADARLSGYLIDHETRKGRPARIALGDPMPTEIEILPSPDRLADCCTVAALREGIEAPSPPADCDAELAEIEI